MSLGSSGVLSGTPLQTGSFNFSLIVRDSLGNTGGAQLQPGHQLPNHHDH